MLSEIDDYFDNEVPFSEYEYDEDMSNYEFGDSLIEDCNEPDGDYLFDDDPWLGMGTDFLLEDCIIDTHYSI